MVHTAVGYARQRNRLATFACTTSIGPGATNMVTGAALATINRIPVLLLPGDVFSSRAPDPVLQQLEVPWAGDVSVNDVFRPVSRYFDRIMRPEQIVPAAELIGAAKRPLIVAGGGVIYSGATEALRKWVDATGIPVAETQAGKGALPFDHPLALGAIGVTGTTAANHIARETDLAIGIGTRWTDFTTASKTAFQDPKVRFINVNVAEFDAQKHAGLALVGDARATIAVLAGWSYVVEPSYREKVAHLAREWSKEVDRLYSLGHTPLPAQSEVIGAMNEVAGPRGVVVCAAGSMPGDLHN